MEGHVPGTASTSPGTVSPDAGSFDTESSNISEHAGPVSFMVPGRTVQGEEEESEEGCKCFPLDLSVCCPCAAAILPRPFYDVQDCTHFVLILGTIAAFLLVLSSVFTIVNGNIGCTTDDPWCVVSQFGAAPLTLLFAMSVVLYCQRILRQYDGALQAKRNSVREQKENLVRRYQGLLSEMETLLNKSAESATALAERSFESKRRDFARFLERAKLRFPSAAIGGDDEELLEHFRRFCLNWLHVFKECSIDPINHPRMVATEDELMRCTQMIQIADLCLERLRAMQVRFVSCQREEDARMLNQGQANLRRLVVTSEAHASARALLDAPASGPDAVMQVPTMTDPRELQRQNEARRQSWLRCGRYGCRWKASRGEDSYPKEFCFGCGRLILLSREHLQLIFQFFFGWLLIAFEIVAFVEKFAVDTEFDHYYFYAVCTALALTQLCIITLLAKFEELDVIQQMEQEVKELKRQNLAVETQRQRMGEFWAQAQQLTDLWLYRTVPRLDLYKELHSQLEDSSPDDLVTNMVGANKVLQDLETSLGALEAWRVDGELGLEEKKMFGREINSLCHEQDFEELVVKIEDVASGAVLKKMKALPAGSKTSSNPRRSVKS